LFSEDEDVEVESIPPPLAMFIDPRGGMSLALAADLEEIQSVNTTKAHQVHINYVCYYSARLLSKSNNRANKILAQLMEASREK